MFEVEGDYIKTYTDYVLYISAICYIYLIQVYLDVKGERKKREYWETMDHMIPPDVDKKEHAPWYLLANTKTLITVAIDGPYATKNEGSKALSRLRLILAKRDRANS